MDQAKSVTATFRHDTFSLHVTFAGDGFGTVSSEPIGFAHCGFNCFTELDAGTEVYLWATPDMNNEFLGWSGDCTGTDCRITMDEAKEVTVTFRHYINLYPSIFGATAGSGDVHGQISFSPENGPVCVAYDWTAGVKHCEAIRFYPGQKVILTFTSGPGHTLNVWDSTDGLCTPYLDYENKCQIAVTTSTPGNIYVNGYFSP
jgi:hypothetical protein